MIGDSLTNGKLIPTSKFLLQRRGTFGRRSERVVHYFVFVHLIMYIEQTMVFCPVINGYTLCCCDWA